MGIAHAYMTDPAQQQTPTKKVIRIAPRQHARGTLSAWSQDSISGAIQRAAIGDFSSTTRLMRSMLTDATYAAALRKRIGGVLRSKFSLEGDLPDPIHHEVEELWWSAVPELQLQGLLTSYLSTGVGLGWISWYPHDGLWVPCMDVYDTETLRWDDTNAKWTVQTKQGTQDVVPGDGNWILLSSWIQGQPPGIVSNIGNIWFQKASAASYWSTGAATSAQGTVVVKDESEKNPDDDIDDLLTEIVANRNAGVLYAGKGIDVQWHNAMAGFTHGAFADQVKDADSKILIAVLGGNVGTEISDVGARASAEVHNNSERSLIASDAEILSTQLREQLLRPIIETNYGDQYDIPWPRWAVMKDESDPGDQLANVEKLMQLVGPGFRLKDPLALANSIGIEIEQIEGT